MAGCIHGCQTDLEIRKKRTEWLRQVWILGRYECSGSRSLSATYQWGGLVGGAVGQNYKLVWKRIQVGTKGANIAKLLGADATERAGYR